MPDNGKPPPDTPWVGGYKWNPLRVDWSASAEGAWRHHPGPGRPKAGHTLWSTHLREQNNIGASVYALHRSTGTVYIGRASLSQSGPQLHPRMRAHWQTDEHVDRWTSFSWIAENRRAPQANAAIGIEMIELIAVRFANPPNNNQMPALPNAVTWLDQVDQLTPSVEDVVERTYRLQ